MMSTNVNFGSYNDLPPYCSTPNPPQLLKIGLSPLDSLRLNTTTSANGLPTVSCLMSGFPGQMDQSPPPKPSLIHHHSSPNTSMEMDFVTLNSDFTTSSPTASVSTHHHLSSLSSCIGKSGEKASRGLRCGKRPKPVAEQVKKTRRLAANARERKRMNSLNSAFELLREVIPSFGNDRKLSKYETLQMAQSYIGALQELITRDDPKGEPEDMNNV